MIARIVLLGVAAGLASCAVGPDYRRPPAIISASYKEAPLGWKLAAPEDTVPKGAWWGVFADPELDRLERQIDFANQTLMADAASYRNALALLASARSALYPTLGATAGATRAKAAGGGAQTQYSLEAQASWELDVWGRIRRQVESSRALAQASGADLANARLSAQAALATAYLGLRVSDALQRLLDSTVANDRRALRITENQYGAGVAARSDVLTAQTQLDSARSAAINIGIARAQYEHAVAVLIGKPPASVTIVAVEVMPAVPDVPQSLPSALLERRPDIAAAERTMQAQNALIGAAIAAYYPTISLSAAFGYAGDPLGALFEASNQLWSAGANAGETLFAGGARSAAVEAARATYEGSVATYRQTVLTALQQVEDELVNQRVLAVQAGVQDEAVADASRAAAIALNAYRAGTQAYTSVVVAQNALLAAQQTALGITQSRLTGAVALIAALGGGWQSRH